MNRAPLRSRRAASVMSGDEVANSEEPSRTARRQNWKRWKPSHPIVAWMTPCNSRSVNAAGTSTRRHTIGLTSISQALI
jgi:hypothetical protein